MGSPTLASQMVDFSYYIYIIHRTSFRKCKLALLTRNLAHAEFKCGQNIENNIIRSAVFYHLSPTSEFLPSLF